MIQYFVMKYEKKPNSTIQMTNTNFEGLYKGKDHIFQNFQNKN